MPTTRQIPREEWQQYFDSFTRRHLGQTGGVVNVQALSQDIGDQVLAEHAHLTGLSYDPHDQVLSAMLEGAEHLVFRPAEVWVLEGDHEDVLATFEFVHEDGTKEILQVQGGGAVTQAPKPAA